VAGDDRVIGPPRVVAVGDGGQSLPARYRVIGEIGRGAMGRVYRAHDTTLGRDVAIKVIESADLHDNRPERERFVREARAAARLHHPNIAVVHDVDPEAGWLVMELVEGQSLRTVLKQALLPAATALKIARQVLSALVAAHAAGVIHRDIKPSNIMIGSELYVKLVDFGIARLLELEDTGNSPGTPAYMAPEQMRGGRVDHRADLFSLGATLYEAVVGERAIAFDQAKLAAACTDQPVLAEVIARCLQIDPEARFASARDALAVLEHAPAARRRERRFPSWWYALALVMIVAGSVGGYLVGHRGTKPRDPRVERAFLLAQRGENDKALQILADYLGGHADDADARTLAFLATWWQGGAMNDAARRIAPLALRPEQRAMIDGIVLITERRDPEAIAFLQSAAKEHPNKVEIEYALGEAMWHGQQLEAGATMLAQAFMLDPRWEMALYHVREYRLSRGETDALAPIADKLRAVDAPAAAALDCDIAIAQRDYPHAIEIARTALANTDKIPELYICMAQAQALAGDIAAGEATAKTAFQLWPVETQDRGGFAQYAEFFLYRGQLDQYLDLTRGRPSSQRALAILLHRPELPVDVPKPEWPAKRMAPLGAATWLLQQHVHHVDASSVYETYPEPEIRAWGAALDAETRDDRDGAAPALREALAVPAKGDIRMLVAHELARVLHEDGDAAGAAEACDEVIRPRFYIDYRAVLLPDCVAWTKSP
jgi:tRNA A-37 threonylcarbamoyl transferase component Bud32